MNQSALLDVDTARSVTNKVYPWKFRARVLSLWKVPDHMLPVSSSSIDMVLIDKEVKWMFIFFMLKCNISYFLKLICYVLSAFQRHFFFYLVIKLSPILSLSRIHNTILSNLSKLPTHSMFLLTNTSGCEV